MLNIFVVFVNPCFIVTSCLYWAMPIPQRTVNTYIFLTATGLRSVVDHGRITTETQSVTFDQEGSMQALQLTCWILSYSGWPTLLVVCHTGADSTCCWSVDLIRPTDPIISGQEYNKIYFTHTSKKYIAGSPQVQ